ncbi:MAG: hypothetical protein ACREJ0_03725 [Geminicoccaceae bacterium]
MQTRQAGGGIRRLWPSERGKVRDHLLRLDRDDRLLRFGGHASAARITAYCARLDWRRGLIVGYVTGGRVRGIGDLKLLGPVGPGPPSSPSRSSAGSRTAASAPRCCGGWWSPPATG